VAVADLMAALKLRPDEVNVVYRSHVLVDSSASLDDGDRVAHFPPLVSTPRSSLPLRRAAEGGIVEVTE
jgi:hypothetical protein